MSLKKIIIGGIFILTFLLNFFHTNAQESVNKETLFENEKVQRSEKSVEVFVHKKNDVYEVKSMEITMKKWPYRGNFQSYVGYNGVIISFLGVSLGYFDAEEMNRIVQCWDEVVENGGMRGGCEKLPEGDLTLIIPYFPNGKYADIYNAEGKKVFTIDLSSKATCNENSNCDRPLEDSINCPSDCKSSQPVIESSLKQQSSIQNETSSQVEQSWWENWGKLALAALILAVVGIGVMVAKQRRY